MIDLHTHTLFSDGVLLPSELVRRAEAVGYKAIALTDHVDSSNIDFVLPRIVKVCKVLNRYWRIRSIPGVEITHAPLEEIATLVKYSRRNGAGIVVVHGETVAEPVISGTNRRGIEARCDILAHPGKISRYDVRLARRLGVCLELTTRKNHSYTNKHIYNTAKRVGARLVLNTDAHSPRDLVSDGQAARFLQHIGINRVMIKQIHNNSLKLVKKAGFSVRKNS